MWDEHYALTHTHKHKLQTMRETSMFTEAE